ncbi:OmpA family protein [Marinagarivorans algicola]|uniref:OmpA family protein n=1 Tax=Marinagarivorans algicola TaxID=1513270 RepID=UPI0006B662F6|nr:OmpA family protein [Marinagarivorans algicola]
MKKMSMLKAAVSAVTLGAMSHVAVASDFEIGIGAPYYGFDKELNLEDKVGVNLNAGYRFNKPFGLELSYSQVATDINGIDTDVADLRLDGLWYLANEGKILPYAAFGVGMLETEVDGFDAEDEETVNFGLGVKTHLSQRIRARIDGRWLHGLDSHSNHSVITLGLGYVFGASTPAPKIVAAEFTDNDKDGVEDSADMCANTPAGVNVDAKGCALDTDRDGVADHLDNCADTDKKLKVDAVGCPVVLSEDVSIDLSVKFSSGSDVVDAAYFNEIRGVARFMEQYENSEVVIEGHTDTSGSAAFNKKLSQKRADAVAALIVEQYGIESHRVKAMGYGEEQPLVAENSKADQATNRRVVAKVSAKKEVLEVK